MALSRRPGLIALFDVDGTLTAPRKVTILIQFILMEWCLLVSPDLEFPFGHSNLNVRELWDLVL